jgi:UDP-N-acetylglucosamine 2-epimerase (non-hydrolysing)
VYTVREEEQMLKVMLVFGTRPEAIKMAPLVKAIEREPDMEAIVCVTAQHREMLDQVLTLFEITQKYDLNLMKAGQSLSDITAGVLKGLEEVLKSDRPDLLLVHGDTTTTLSAALAAFYQQIPVGHVEAGLRSGNIYSPYPEEMNRMLASKLASIHFAATDGNVANLLNEGVSPELIFKTGNTVIDALKMMIKPGYQFETPLLNQIDYDRQKVMLMTAHRRENLGEPMADIFKAIRDIVDAYPEASLIFPMHLNPNVRKIAKAHFDGCDRIHLIEPLPYEAFANLQGRVSFILTDSGGIQEEAPALGKPVVVLRKETERPEAVEAGTVVIAGVCYDDVKREIERLIVDAAHYSAMSEAVNPYGDGTACEQIVKAIKQMYR